MTQKQLGIWMDHSNAKIIYFTSGTANLLEEIETEFTKEEKEKVLLKGESAMHNKEQQKVKEYYTKLMVIIIQYNDVILFGPTNAKTELFNLIKKDRKFDKINIATGDCDYATPNQITAFVTDYYSNK